MSNQLSLKFSNICVKNKALLNEGTFCMNDHGVILIHGKNGCGKTLLLKNIKFSNPDVKLQYVSQECNNVIDDITVIENLTMGDTSKEELARQYLIRLGFPYLETRKASKLSGGEQRIIALGRAFLSDCNLILLDEPTNELQHATVELLHDIIREYSTDKLFLIVSHDDRLDDLSEANITIIDQRIHSSNEDIVFLQTYEKTEPKNIDSTYKEISGSQLKRIIKHSWRIHIFVLFTFLFLAFSIYHSISCKATDSKEKSIPVNQAHIYFVGEAKNGDLNHSYPATLYPILLDAKIDTNIVKKVKAIGNRKNEQTNITDDLFSLEKDSSLSVFYLRFCKTEGNSITDSAFAFDLEQIYRELYSLPYNQYIINYNDYFEHPAFSWKEDDRTVVSFEYDKYLACLEYIFNLEENYVPCYAVIKYNNNTNLNHFMNNPLHSSIFKNNDIYLHTTESEQIADSIIAFLFFRANLSSYIYESSIFIILGIIYLCIYIRLHMKAIDILCNYGINKKRLVKTISMQLIKPDFWAMICSFFFLLISYFYSALSIANCFTLLLVYISCTILFIIAKMGLMFFSITYVYRWNYR